MREHIAWLLYCLDQGYTKAEDRALLENWLLVSNNELTTVELELKADLLAMADEVIAEVVLNG
jgi:hypothetical protein